jgi:Cu/Ag efflux protein CusF
MRFVASSTPALRAPVAQRAAIVIAIAVAAMTLCAPLYAQNAPASDAQPAAPASVPAGMVQVGEIETVAHVVSVDAASNSVTLRGERGNQTVVAVDPKVANVSKLAPGDQVNILYKEALLLRADKVDSKGIRARVETVAQTPASDGVTATARSVQVVATVQKIDRKHRKVTLRGPNRTVVVHVPNDVPLEKLKVGDSIRADYVGATAVEVTRNGERVQ